MPYNGKCDIWSLGCVLYELAALRLPFLAKDITELRKKILSGHYERIPSCFSEELESFIRMCLEVNSKDRLNAEELLHTTFIRKRLYLYPNDKFNHASL